MSLLSALREAESEVVRYKEAATEADHSAQSDFVRAEEHLKMARQLIERHHPFNPAVAGVPNPPDESS